MPTDIIDPTFSLLPSPHSFRSSYEALEYLIKQYKRLEDIPRHLLVYYNIYFATDRAMEGWDIKEPEKPITSEFFTKVRKTMEDVHQSQLQRLTKKIKRKILRNAAIGNSRMAIMTNKNEAVIKQMCNQLKEEGFEASYSRDYNVAGQHKIYISWYTA